MATVLYFHDAALVLPGTFPSGEQSSSTPDVTWAGAATVRRMDTVIGTGQILVAQAHGATGAQIHFARMFCTPFLSSAQTVGGGTARFNCADRETSLSENFFFNGLNLYVWRPGTGAIVGTLIDQVAALGGSEPTAFNSTQVTRFTFATAAISGAAGDVVICELWSSFIPTVTGTLGLAYDGTTENDVENAVVTNHASLLELAETLTFSETVGGQRTLTLTGVGA